MGDTSQQRAAVLKQAREYLEALKADGTLSVEVSLAAAAAVKPRGRGAGTAVVSPRPVAGSGPAATRPQLPVSPPRTPAAARGPFVPAKVPQPSGGTATPASSSDPVVAELGRIAAIVARCAKCPLHRGRIRTVPGQGHPHPEIVFVGEAPGADEDRQGLAFVGDAGQLLTRMIEAMGLTRDDVFIANTVKCRPPDNRKPAPDELAACMPYLRQQLAVLAPKVIVGLGATATHALIGAETPISQLRGRWTQFESIDLMPTYHPAYLLRNPSAKREVWSDLQAVLKRLGRTPPPKPAAAS